MSAGDAGNAGSGIGRREFLRRAGVGAALLGAGAGVPGCATSSDPGAPAAAPPLARGRPDVAVVGAGAFGGWTALHLRRLGARVTLVDAWGPGNSRSTSGDETRGVRTSYGEKELWVRWAGEAIRRWRAWDEEQGGSGDPPLFSTTSDLILREDPDDEMIVQNCAAWDRLGHRYEVLGPDEVAYRWPQIRVDGITIALRELDAGVVRARAACLSVAEAFRREGGEIVIARATPGRRENGRLLDLALDDGRRLDAGLFVFACGPWLGRLFPDVMGPRLRIPMGHVYYFATPPGDHHFTHPNLPSYNFPGVTGWPSLPHDARGFRVRTGGRAADDPDASDRWIPAEFHEQPREVLAERFPDLADAPILETRACHYELSSSRHWVIASHPAMANAWIAGGGSAEGFKFGPVLGPYIAARVLGEDSHPEIAATVGIPAETFDP